MCEGRQSPLKRPILYARNRRLGYHRQNSVRKENAVIALTQASEDTHGRETDKDALRIGLALFATYVIWGSTFLGMRIALEGLPPFLMAGSRFLLAGGAILLLLRGQGMAWPAKRQWGGAALVGVLLLGGGNGGVVMAEHLGVSSGLAALGAATVPLWASLFAGLWGEWPTKRECLGLGVGFAGVVCLSLEGGLRASPWGAMSLLISSVCWAFGSIWSRRLPLPPGLSAPGAQMLCGGLLLLSMSGLTREHLPAVLHLRTALAFGYLVLAATVGYGAYAFLLQRVRPALATSNAYVNPVIAVALGAAFAGERVTAIGIAALLLILTGVALTAFTKAPKKVVHS